MDIHEKHETDLTRAERMRRKVYNFFTFFWR